MVRSIHPSRLLRMVTTVLAVNYTPRDSVPRSLGDQSSVEWNILQDLPTDVVSEY
jgi:hypothetical protein